MMITLFLLAQQGSPALGVNPPIPEGATVAVLDFEPIGADVNLARAFEESLVTSLISTGRFKVVERTQMKKLLSEAKLSLSGIISEDQAKAIGGILGADYLVIGSISKIGGYEKYIVNVRVVKSDTGEAVFASRYQAYSRTQLVSLSDKVALDLSGRKSHVSSRTAQLLEEFYSLTTPRSSVCIGLGFATPTIGVFKKDGFGFPRFWTGFSLHTLGFTFRWFAGVPSIRKIRLAYRDAIRKLGPAVPASYRIRYVRKVIRRRVFPYFELGLDMLFLPAVGLGCAWVPSSHFIIHAGVRFGLLHYLVLSGTITPDDPELARYFTSTLISFGLTFAF